MRREISLLFFTQNHEKISYSIVDSQSHFLIYIRNIRGEKNAKNFLLFSIIYSYDEYEFIIYHTSYDIA